MARGHLSINTRSDLRQRVKAAMRDANIHLPVNPGAVTEEEQFPRDITMLDDQQLGQQMSFWTAQLGYLNTYLARCEIDMLAYKKERRDYELAHKRNSLEGKKPSEKRAWEAEAELAGDEMWEGLSDQYMFAEALVIQLRALKSSYEGYYATASRELTRRLGERDRADGRGGYGA
jgi:hypothetical protein